MNNLYDHDSTNEEKWTQRALTYDDKRYNYFRFMQRILVESINIRPNMTFLDLGCGTGWAVRYIATKMKGQGKLSEWIFRMG
jgi:ubiquinone/menaquinone biosynthesis C-methylase UbiE